ncbi:hypothetical protein ABK040_009925 [Willaertia magna]
MKDDDDDEEEEQDTENINKEEEEQDIENIKEKNLTKEDEEILRELEEEDEENEEEEDDNSDGLIDEEKEFKLNKWIYPIHERNEKTREMRYKLINYLFLLNKESIYQKFLQIHITDTKICLFNINGNGNYIIVKFNHTSAANEMTIVKLKFVNYLQNLELSNNSMTDIDNNNNYNFKPKEKTWQTGEIYDDGYILFTFEEIYNNTNDDELFHLVSIYKKYNRSYSYGDRNTFVYVDKEILQKAMTFIGLTSDFVNDENCIMDFHMFISTHLAAYFKLLSIYPNDFDHLYIYKTKIL